MRYFPLLLLALSACANHPAAPSKALPLDANELPTIVPSYSSDELTTACQQALKVAQAEAKALEQLNPGEATVETFLEPWDASGAKAQNTLSPIYLLAYVHPDEAIRKAGEKCILKVTDFKTQLFQNPKLYERAQRVIAKDPVSFQFREKLLQKFLQNGVHLPTEKRQRAAAITRDIERFSQGFQARLRDQKGTILLSEADVEGVPESWKAAAKVADGEYAANFDYPSYFPFMRNAKNADARQRYYLAFTRRGGEENLRLLDKINQLRQELARLHGLDNYAQLATRNRMLNSPEKIEAFLNQVAGPVFALEQKDLETLQALKAKDTGEASAALERWDLSYYLEQARQQQFNIDQEALRQYFPTEATVQWALWINEQLFGISIRPIQSTQWHADIQSYAVYDHDSGEHLGQMFLDLYPRDGKYKHAAAFPLRSGSRLLGQRPASALVTNFDRNGLSHSEVETLMHELGHVFHGLFSQTWYASHSGTEVKRDFVEAPSQMLEAWARRYETLKEVSRFCEPSCPRIDRNMVDQLEAARLFGQGTFYARQHLYASFDMALASSDELPAQALWEYMETQTALGHLVDSQFPGTFGHIAGGYAAGYYGYMWSETLALDMQSLFGEQLMNSDLGKRYRKEVLARGGEVPPLKLLQTFLGREPSHKAFFEQFEPKP